MTKKKAPLLSNRLKLFMGTMILANIASHMYTPLMPLYLQELGADVGQVGLFFTLGAVAPLAFQIFGGWLSDAIGRLQAIAIGSVAGVAGYAVYLLAPSWQWLLIATATGAMARSFVAPSYMAFIAEESTEETRGQVYGLSQSLFMIVGIVGPPIGGYLSQYLGFRALFIFAGVLYTTATIIRLWMARDAQRSQHRTGDKPSLTRLKADLLGMVSLVLAGGVVTWIFISDGVRDVTFGMAFQLLPLYMQNLMGLSNVEISWLSSIHSLTTMLFLTPAGLGVEPPAYLKGLAEAASEMRRYALDLMRQNKLERAEEMLGIMDQVYGQLMTVDFPDAITGGLRRTTDMLRGVVQRTRGDLTTAFRQEMMRQALHDFEQRIGMEA